MLTIAEIKSLAVESIESRRNEIIDISKHILENHQGNIVVNSNVNDGSEFIITLPLDKTNITP